MDYSEILSRAWQIIWKHKILWIFGILAGCASGGGGGGGGGGNISNQQEASEPLQRTFENIPPEVLTAIIIGVVCLVLIIVVISIFLGTIGKIGLIRGAIQADQDMEARLTFGELFQGSLPYFWRVFLLSLLVGIVIFLVVGAALMLGIFGTAVTLGLGLICLIPMICLLIPVGIVVSVLVDQSSIAIVSENLGIIEGLQRGWYVIRNNLGPIAVIWLILELGVRFIGGIILGLPILLILTPLLVSFISGSEPALSAGAIISAICFIGYLPFLIGLSGVLNSYVQSGWTLTFRRLTKSQAPAEPLPEPAP